MKDKLFELFLFILFLKEKFKYCFEFKFVNYFILIINL